MFGRLLRRRRVGELWSGCRTHALDVERLKLDDLDADAVVLELVDRALGALQSPGQRCRVANDVDDVRRLDQLSVDIDPADTVLERGLCDDPDLTVELHRLGSCRAQLLNG